MYLIEDAINMKTRVGRTDKTPFPKDLNVFLKFQSDAIKDTKIPAIKKMAINATTV